MTDKEFIEIEHMLRLLSQMGEQSFSVWFSSADRIEYEPQPLIQKMEHLGLVRPVWIITGKGQRWLAAKPEDRGKV